MCFKLKLLGYLFPEVLFRKKKKFHPKCFMQTSIRVAYRLDIGGNQPNSVNRRVLGKSISSFSGNHLIGNHGLPTRENWFIVVAAEDRGTKNGNFEWGL